MRSCLFFVALIASPASLAQLKENMPCNNSVSMKAGTCRKEADCPGARAQNASPCSYKRGKKIVCCDVSVPRMGKDVGAVARQKCMEYSRVNVSRANVFSLVGDEPDDILSCSLGGQELITGGVEANPKEFPHMVNLGFNRTDNQGISVIDWSCGGALISPRYVLTAAHCLFDSYHRSTPYLAWARLGDLDMSTDDDDADILTKRITDWIPHPDYKAKSTYHDIALVKLEDDVEFSEYIRPACLNVNLTPRAGLKTIASGWGAVRGGGEVSPTMMKVRIPVVGHAACNRSFAQLAGSRSLARGIDNDLQLCAGESGKDTCQGDSGGPLQVLLTDPDCMYSLIGVTSFGPRACGAGNAVGVYTRVSNYVSWIEGIVWP